MWPLSGHAIGDGAVIPPPQPNRQLFAQLNDHIYECSRAPLCRHHHRAKQAQGWHLDQLEPGVLIWRTPSGRTYTKTPTAYPL